MKYDEIVKMLDAGFTKDEIIDSMVDEKEENNDKLPIKPTESTESSNESSVNVINEAIVTALNEVKDAVQSFKNELTAMNIMNSQQQPESKSTSEQILASIINPSNEEK